MIVIEDNFYPNPDEVRELALSEFFYAGSQGTNTYFPGKRTVGSFSNDNRLFVKNRLQGILTKKIIDFPRWNSNCAFTLGLEKQLGKPLQNWVHQDEGDVFEQRTNALGGMSWAAVIYLQPKASVKKGTGMFRHLETMTLGKTEGVKGKIRNAGFKESWEENGDWEMHTYIGNVYNRAVVYPATMWHAPFDAGFGHNKKSGRLVQVCFFITEK